MCFHKRPTGTVSALYHKCRDCLRGTKTFLARHSPLATRHSRPFWLRPTAALCLLLFVFCLLPCSAVGAHSGDQSRQQSSPAKPDPVARAEEDLRRATTPRERSFALVELGQAYFAKGEEDRAEQQFKAALEADATNAEAHLELGQVRLFQRRVALAEAEFRSAIRVAPNQAAGYAALAELLIQTGRNAEARELLEKAVALDPSDWSSEYQLAKVLGDAGEVGKARELLEKVVEGNPDFLPAREQLGLELVRRGDLKGATVQAEALIAKHPQAPEGHRLMALILWRQPDFEASLAECAMALAADPDSKSMQLLQALELWELDRKKEARAAFVRAAKGQPALASADVFCRLVVCGARDIALVDDFLRKNRWALQPVDGRQ